MPGEAITLRVMGPKTIIRKEKVVCVSADDTWHAALKKIKISTAKMKLVRFVCSSHYTLSDPGNGRGWRAELTDVVGEFVANFRKPMKAYIVRICGGSHAQRNVPGYSGGMAWNNQEYRQRYHDVNDVYDDPLASQRTTDSEEAYELNLEGIAVQELKSPALEKMQNIPNRVFLKAKDEIQKMKQSGSWHRYAGRVPTVCHLLREILQE